MAAEILTLFFLVILPVAIYATVARNDLARRYERLRGLSANVVATRERRHGVQGNIASQLAAAQRHEQKIMRYGPHRGRGGGHLVNDIANGWPNAGATTVTGQAMGLTAVLRNSETAARIALHEEAEKYNQVVRTWPTSLIAKAFGFQPWRFKGPSGRNRKKSPRRSRHGRT